MSFCKILSLFNKFSFKASTLLLLAMVLIGRGYALDVTSYVTLLGSPLVSRYPSGDDCYARNVWDLQVFNNKIYIASGNSGNNAPAPNPGPVDLYYYDTNTFSFIKDVTLAQEEVESFRVFNNQLYIPGRDPRNNTLTDEACYIRSQSGWTTIMQSGFYHCRDVVATTSAMVITIQPYDTGALRISNNNGNTWREINFVSQDPVLRYAYCTSMSTLFWIGNKLYCSGDLFSLNTPNIYTATKGVNTPVACIDSTLTTATVVTTTTLLTVMFPGMQSQPFYRVFRPLQVNGMLVCIAATTRNSRQTYLPLGLYKIQPNGVGAAITLTDNALPWDIIQGEDGRIYVLGAIDAGGGKYTVTVSSAPADLSIWHEDFRFLADSFARSFEQFHGKFYFGLGCDYTTLSDASGNILMYSPPTTDATISDFTVSQNDWVNNLEHILNKKPLQAFSLVFGSSRSGFIFPAW